MDCSTRRGGDSRASLPRRCGRVAVVRTAGASRRARCRVLRADRTGGSVATFLVTVHLATRSFFLLFALPRLPRRGSSRDVGAGRGGGWVERLDLVCVVFLATSSCAPRCWFGAAAAAAMRHGRLGGAWPAVPIATVASAATRPADRRPFRPARFAPAACRPCTAAEPTVRQRCFVFFSLTAACGRCVARVRAPACVGGRRGGRPPSSTQCATCCVSPATPSLWWPTGLAALTAIAPQCACRVHLLGTS